MKKDLKLKSLKRVSSKGGSSPRSLPAIDFLNKGAELSPKEKNET